jgi:Ssp1 endopeptidase immunity protein Rap1a
MDSAAEPDVSPEKGCLSQDATQAASVRCGHARSSGWAVTLGRPQKFATPERVPSMRILMALIATLMTIPGALAREQVLVESAKDLVRACRSIDAETKRANPRATIPVTNEMLVCLGYMQAIQDFAVLADKDGIPVLGACTPPDTTLKQMVRSFIRYTDTHRDELKNATAGVVVQSLRAAFPCDSNTSTIRDLGR